MKSLLSVSMHKAGSTIADWIVLEFCEEANYKIDRISKKVSGSPLSEAEIFIGYQDKMINEGVYYGMARGMYVRDMPKIYDIKIIVQVRDPRDCLTSAYFSFRDSHAPPKNRAKLRKFEEQRSEISQLSIDKYAATKIGQYRKRMQILRSILESHDDILLLKYEEMVENTEVWLRKVSAFLGQPLTKELRARLADKIDFSVTKEDASKHKRQVTPGDHIRKLKDETISYMNEVAGRELSYFGYLS